MLSRLPLMKTVISALRSGRNAAEPTSPNGDGVVGHGGDDALGRGMDMALTIAVFIAVGALLDRWLGTFPVAIIACIVLASVGSFLRMKYVYDEMMDRHEAERSGRMRLADEDAS